MKVNTSYYVNNETGAVIHVQSVNVVPIELTHPQQKPTTQETTTTTTETTVNKDSENEVHGGTDHASEVEDLIA